MTELEVRMGPRMTIIAATLIMGCTPLQGGAGSGTTVESVGSDGTSGDSTSGETAPSTVGDETADAGSSGGGETSSPGSTSTTDGTDESSGGSACGDADTAAMFAEDGDVEPPMMLAFSKTLDIQYAFSTEPEEGRITFELETTCEGPLYLWGLVWDFTPGVEPNNPDSYYVAVDGGDEIIWEYGCDTESSAPSSWTWVQVGASKGGCGGMQLAPSLSPGTHTIEIRNREDGGEMEGNAAAIAGIAYSHDSSMDPTTFDPS